MYSLLRACKIVRKTDDSAVRMSVFKSVLRNSGRIRCSYKLYQYSPAPVKAALIVAYGLKCYLSLAWAVNESQQLLFFAAYPSEHQVLGQLQEKLDGIEHGEVTISLQNLLRPGLIADMIAFAPSIVRLYRFAGQLARQLEFMPACRVFSVVPYYMRSTRLLAGSRVKAVFIASHYSPEALGLAAAAHQNGKKVLFTNHAVATVEMGYVQPLYADLVAATSEALADLYRRHTPKKLRIIPVPLPTPQDQMRVPDPGSRPLVVGIYLTALADETRLQQLVSELSGAVSIGSVFIRTHPAVVVNSDLSGIAGPSGPVEISGSGPLQRDIARTDIAICGNSTVAIELLRGGRPVFYDHRLDDLMYDYNGYAGHRLVLELPNPFCDDLLNQARQHFLSEEWQSKMRYFDSSYQKDETAMWDRFRREVEDVLDA